MAVANNDAMPCSNQAIKQYKLKAIRGTVAHLAPLQAWGPWSCGRTPAQPISRK